MTDNESDLIQLIPIWKDKYSKLGVSPRELYLRQKGLCWIEVINDGEESELYCTDGKDKAKTNCMLNPTIECVKCITNFTKVQMSQSNEKDK